MATEVLHPASRSEWLELRKATIGASDAPCLLGISPWSTPFGLWAAKSGLAPPDDETPAMKRGARLEAVAVDILREENPDWIIKANPMPGGEFYRDLDLGLSATPDAEANVPAQPGTRIVQIKNVHAAAFKAGWMESGEVEPPLHVQVQAIQEAYLTGASRAFVAALVVDRGIDLHLVEVPIHQGIITRLKEEAAIFWDRVRRNDPPPPDYGRDGELLASLYRKGGALPIDLSTHNRIGFLCQEKLEWMRRRANAEHALETVDAEIVDVLKDAEAATHPEFNITRKLQKRKAYSLAAWEGRVLRVTRKKSENGESE